MYQGFYDLASGMLTQRRNLDNISNNMTNLQTAGYKKDTMVSQSFSEEMLVRTGRHNKENPKELAVTSKINSASRTYTDYEQGSFEMTDNAFDFALSGRGFFSVQTGDGLRYTRNGAFSLDGEGYLTLSGVGRVLGENGEPIQLPHESFTVGQDGSIYADELHVVSGEEEDSGAEAGMDTEGETGSMVREFLGKIRVVDFADYEALHKEDNGLFSTNQEGFAAGAETQIQWKMLEKSNVDMVREMTTMMSSQRALQSAAQMLKMYDSILSKASSEVGRL